MRLLAAAHRVSLDLTTSHHLLRICIFPKNVRIPQAELVARIQQCVTFSILICGVGEANLPCHCCAGPLTQLVRRTLSVTNNNDQPVAFKVKTTAPKVSIFRLLKLRHDRLGFRSYTAFDQTPDESNRVVASMCKVCVPWFPRGNLLKHIIIFYPRNLSSSATYEGGASCKCEMQG